MPRRPPAQVPPPIIGAAAQAGAENLELPPDLSLSDAAVLEPIPKTMHKRATTLLERLKTRPDLVSWNERGQVTLGGEKILDSNITDLVSDAMRPRKNLNPTGSRRLFRVVSELNVPKDVARNEQRWQQSKAGGTPVFGENTSPRAREIQNILEGRANENTTPRSRQFRSILKGKRWVNY